MKIIYVDARNNIYKDTKAILTLIEKKKTILKLIKRLKGKIDCLQLLFWI